MSYENILRQELKKNKNYFLMTAENLALIRGLSKELGPDQFLDTGITEQTMVGMAAGLASRGRTPIIHALATFLTLRAFEFIRTDIGISAANVKLTGFVPGFLSDGNGPTHQAIEDVSLLRGIPNMNVYCPGDLDDLMIGLPHILASQNAFYIRYTGRPSPVKHDTDFKIGKAETVFDGKDVALLTYGTLFPETVVAAQKLKSDGISVRLINLRTLKPIDQEAVIKAAKECSMMVTVEDHFVTGGLYSIVSEILVKNRLNPHVLPLALENKWFQPGLLNDVIEFEGFSGPQIASKIFETFKENQNAK